jgi:HSP20 family protein
MVTVKGEKKHEKEEKGENYYLAERSFGSFERSIRLPDTIDESRLEAKFDKGVLKVTASKKMSPSRKRSLRARVKAE